MTQVPRKITLGIPVSLGATTTLDGSQTTESSSITSTGVSSASSSASALYSLLLSGSTSRNDCPTTVGDKDGQDPSWVPQQNSTSCAPPLFTTGHHFLSSPLMSTAPLHMQASSSNSVATTDVTHRPSTFVKPAPPKVSSSNFLQAAGEVGDSNVSTTPGTATNVSGTTPPKPSEMKSATPSMSNFTWFAELSKSTGQRCAVNRSGKLQTVSSSLRNLEEQNLEVSLEDRLYGIWRQIIPHCASKKIVIWAHQQGGTALIHPLRPMPGAFPGFTPAQFNTTPSASLEESVSVLTGGNQRKYVGVSGAFLRHDVRNSSDARGNSAEIAPSSFRPKSDQTISPFLRSRALQCHITAPNVRIGGVSINPPRTRYYSTRRRHVSANAVLTSSSTHSESLDNTYSSAVPMHAYVKQQEIVHFDSDLLQRAVSARIQLADIEEMRSKASAGRLWLDRRVYGPWRHHVSPAAARRAFQMPTDSNPTPPIGTTPSSSNTQETASSEPREHSLPSLSGSDVDTELFAQRGGVVPRGVGNWGPNPHVEDENLLKIRLARAWQRKAQRLQTELISRVQAVVFTDCPSILNLALEGIGWGLHMLNESKTASGGCDVPTLFKVSALQSALPEKVASARQWFSQHAIHFVTSDTPIGTRLDDKTKRPVEVPVISSGTTEHDLIPATVLEAVFDFFESKLNPTTAGVDLKGQTIEKTPIINQTSSPAPPSNPIPSASDTTPTTNEI
ncbi:unnamed protein product [Calicophoron daubneyi]|uniref:Uncharacterized protein n=1 Tax=Calicophoron daubneyi TaxID=300641 RepID=A0AAV2TUR4_CALDB